MLCAHCQRRPRSRPRGLCWGCYYTPGIRDRYPRINPFAVRSGEDFRGYTYPPIEPTRALPGSPEKVAVLAERARRRVCLWHPADARLDWDSRILRTLNNVEAHDIRAGHALFAKALRVTMRPA